MRSPLLLFRTSADDSHRWKDIYTRLPKRIYAKVLATAEMEIKYKPKVLVSQVRYSCVCF